MRTKIMIVVVLSALLFSAVSAAMASTANAKNLKDSGVRDTVIWIHNVYDLQNMSKDLSGNYALANDIDASVTKDWNNGAGFVPIGSSAYFTGKFDGRGYKITNLWINRSSGYWVGLFAYPSTGAVIENVTLVNVTVKSSADYVEIGGLIGENAGTVNNCHVIGNVSGTGDSPEVGGVIGWNWGVVNNSYAMGNVSGSYDTGGLIGWNDNGGRVYNSYATASVKGGGISQNGGLVGYNNGTVINSYATGTVSGEIYVGGLIGWNNKGGRVSNSYAVGSVKNGLYSGGLIGSNDGNVSNSYATGTVSGTFVGGLVDENSGTVAFSFWDKQTSGITHSAGGVGKTTAEMKNKATFLNAGWDFTNIWNIVDGKTYPFFRWQEPSKPSEPLYLHAKSGVGYVNLTWTNPTFDGASPITEYRIYRDGSLIAGVPATKLYYNDTSVDSGKSYTYYVTAVNAAGESSESNKVSANVPQPVPELSSPFALLIVVLISTLIAVRRRK